MKILVTSILLFIMICSGLTAAPKPAIVPGALDWTADVKVNHLQQIELKVKNCKTELRFWYVIMTLTNNTNSEIDFYPKCELMTDTFQIITAGENTPPAVFQEIKRRHQSRYPFLESLEQTSNRILRGSDNTKDIVIIWPDFDAKAKNVKLFISGLSNETAAVKHPTRKDKSGMPLRIFLRKTLQLNYSISGDPYFKSTINLKPGGKDWVMR